jgi:predicted phosphodiesterase
VHAGDIATVDHAGDVLRAYRQALPGTPVIAVLGNHDYAGQSAEPEIEWHEAARRYDVHLLTLRNPACEVQGVRFVGCTGWYPQTSATQKINWFDYRYTCYTRQQIWQLNAQHVDLLEREAQRADVIVTHMFPTKRSIDPQYAMSRANDFFCIGSKATDIAAGLEFADTPKLWLHGHTHSPIDYTEGALRVVCAPRGYPNENGRTADNYVGMKIDF